MVVIENMYQIVGRVFNRNGFLVGYKVVNILNTKEQEIISKDRTISLALDNYIVNAVYNKYTKSLHGVDCDLRKLPSIQYDLNMKVNTDISKTKIENRSTDAQLAVKFLKKQELLGINLFEFKIDPDGDVTLFKVLDKESEGKLVVPSFVSRLAVRALHGCRFTEIHIDNKPNVKFNASNLCQGMKSESIKLRFSHWECVTDLSYSFSYCKNLKKIDFENIDTSKVHNMSGMFAYCVSLTNLNLSKFNTSNVTDCSAMFNGCSRLTELNLYNFDTSKAKYFDSMFRDCKRLYKVNLKSFRTPHLMSIDSMFEGCISLKELDLSTFDTPNLISAECMFMNCRSLTQLDIRNLRTDKVMKLSGMFKGCSSIEELDLSHFRTPKLINLDIFLSDCSKLKKVNLSSFNTFNVMSFFSTFRNCSALE